MIYQGKARYPVHEVCLHTAATPGNWHEGMTLFDMMREIRRWHVEMRGWRDIGYHRVVSPRGDIGAGRSIYSIGAGVRGHNRGVVHICLVPVRTHDGIKEFNDYFTNDQRRAVKSYIKELQQLTDITLVSGHNDYTDLKECPGFKVKSEDWL